MLTNCIPLITPISIQNEKYGIELELESDNINNMNKIDTNILLKNTSMQTNVISQTLCSGSALVEIDGTKVLCSVLGPVPQLKNANNDTCVIECNMNSTTYNKDILVSTQSNISLSTNNTSPSTILESALKPIICVDKYPKCIITINVIVLEVYIYITYYIYTYYIYMYIYIM